MTLAQTLDRHNLRNAPARNAFLDSMLDGLSAPEKAIPCRFLYDAAGSRLFDEICLLPEYYPTRTEKLILASHADDIARAVGPDAHFIELGAGSGGKAEWLLDAMPAARSYTCIDISPEPLAVTQRSIKEAYPSLHVTSICADYLGEVELPERGAGRDLCFFPGSTIGNFERADALTFLSQWQRRMGANGLMLIGVDLKKNPDILEAAYDDAQGVTARFSLNVLTRANRELGANFNLAQFRHRAKYIADPGHIRIDLVSLNDQTVTIDGRAFHFAKGEALHIENSHKYSAGEFIELAGRAGFMSAAIWTDPKDFFSIHLLRAGN